MTQHDALVYLWDIQRACTAVLQFATGKTYADYLADELLRSGIERQMITIGEALNHALATDPSLYASITDSEKIISVPHRLIHAYRRKNHEIIWNAVMNDVSILLGEISILVPEPPQLEYF